MNNKEEKKPLDINEEKEKDEEKVKAIDKEVKIIDKEVKVIDTVKEKDLDKGTPLIENVAPVKDKENLKRTVSAPPNVTEVNAPCLSCLSYCTCMWYASFNKQITQSYSTSVWVGLWTTLIKI